MQRRALALLGLLAFVPGAAMAAANTWVEGKHYALLGVPQRTTVPAGKVEVLEVFSYGCPACNRFQPVMEKLKANLPAGAQLAYLHASFNQSESWPMFQRAYITAQALGIADRAHQAIFDAVWKTDELAVVDQRSGRLKTPKPTIEDAARCYARADRRKAGSLPRHRQVLQRRDAYQGSGCADQGHAGAEHAVHRRERQVPREHAVGGKPR